MGNVEEFWRLARKRPLGTLVLGVSTAALGAGSMVALPKLENYIRSPNFSNLSGDYTGRIENGGDFHLCFVRFGNRVLGEMTFERNEAYVDYWGDVDKDKNQLTLHYARGVGSTKPDHGDAVLSQVGKSDLQGYYQSSLTPGDHDALNIERTTQTCDLQHFDHGW